MLITTEQKVLFQGDSITDAGRIRIGNGLGVGYVFICTAYIKKYYPELNIEFINRGISGNTVIDLKNRWQQDCLSLKPDWLTILIGINDCVNKISDEMYEMTYCELLDSIKLVNNNTKIILMEPFILPLNTQQEHLVPLVESKCFIVNKIAKKYNAIVIPLYTIFKNLLKKAPATHWTHDGIHPTPQGHFVIAEEWLKTVKAI